MNIQNKKCLVTGADGFIGSHLVEALVADGAKVKAFVFYNSFNSLGWIDSLPEATKQQLEIFQGDVRRAGKNSSLAHKRKFFTSELFVGRHRAVCPMLSGRLMS